LAIAYYICFVRKLFLFILVLIYCFSIGAQPDTVQQIVAGRKNSVEQQQKPYVLLISADGFRHDYPGKYGAKTLLALSRLGIRADAMIPSYPSLTFPNHYSIATGLYPSHHGLASNYFYSPGRKQFYSMKKPETFKDGSWYGGTPLWVLAEQQQMLTASFYWVGTEAAIKGIHPTYYYYYNEDIPVDRRIQVVVDWLQLAPEYRPHFITFYLSQVDDAGHDYGPDAPETGRAVRWVDSVVQKLTVAVTSTGLPVNFIFVADHGMTRIDNVNALPMPAAVDTTKFFIPRGFELVELYAKNKRDIKPTYKKLKKEEKDFTAYLKTNMPAHLHYRKEDDVKGVIGDILLISTWPKVFNFSTKKPDPGAHGFDPVLVKDMLTIFYAWGPNFKMGMQVPAFENVNVYPVVTKILGLNYTEKIDGSKELAEKIVK
jgi:predicted AlkP superfamily pyrophosphatase or phosphodiesterase